MKGRKMLKAHTPKLKELKKKYEAALSKEERKLEKVLIDFSDSIVDFAMRNEKFSTELCGFFESQNVPSLKEQFLKILEIYKVN